MTSQKKGTLTIAGSGIASVAHLTLETLSYIQEADKIHYALLDPVTEAFVLDKSKDASQCFDLTVYYDKDKLRQETYVQMSEVMLRDVREGYNVLGIFYGHPGVFVSPSHRAMSIAREEGYEAKMLPGVSAEDYLFSDIGFDPSAPGCMTQEASVLLASGKTLDPMIHNIIWQVGAVGVQTMIFNNDKFHLLVDRIEKDFGPEYKLVHYIGAILPQNTTVMQEFKVSDLRQKDIIKTIGTTSTFYLPPNGLLPVDTQMTEKLQVDEYELDPVLAQEKKYAGLKFVNDQSLAAPSYRSFEKGAVERLAEHTVPKDHLFLRGTPALRQFMIDLSLRPELRRRYKEDPASVVSDVQDLSGQEKFGLTLNHPGPILSLMRATQDVITAGSVPTLDEIAETVPDQPNEIPIMCVFGVIVIVIVAA